MVGRFGVRSSIATGLAVMSAGLLVLSIAADRYAPFGILAAIMALVGAGGMGGLVMAPATTTSMSSVAPQQASMASSINSVVRELGGVLGVAVIGTVVATVFRSRFEPGVGTSTADPAQIHAGAPPASALTDAANQAYTSAMSTGIQICAAVAFVGALAVIALFPAPRRPVSCPPADSPTRMTQTLGLRPIHEPHLTDEFRPHPHRTLAVICWKFLPERTFLLTQRFQCRK